MGYIKSYDSLNSSEKYQVYRFINSKDNAIDSIDKLEKEFNIKIYNYGEGVLFYFEEDKVIASVYIVLEVAKQLNSAYIYKIKYLKDIKNKVNIINDLIKMAKEIAKLNGATDIRLGVSKEEVSEEELKELNLSIQYRAVEMSLKDRKKVFNTLDLSELSHLNKEKYIQIYNDSFGDMPHGTITDIDGVDERLNKNENNDKLEYYFIVCDDDNEIGFMEVTIENNKGVFDIGLTKEYRGKGYGKSLLETAIQFLIEKEVENISLIVIEENKVAYNMYEKRGFETSKVIGEWIIL